MGLGCAGAEPWSLSGSRAHSEGPRRISRSIEANRGRLNEIE